MHTCDLGQNNVYHLDLIPYLQGQASCYIVLWWLHLVFLLHWLTLGTCRLLWGGPSELCHKCLMHTW